MRFRRLGESGLPVSVVGLGCNNFGRRIDRDTSLAVVRAALDYGITLFDTADTYGTPPGTSESLLGEALKRERDNIVVATKFGMDMSGSNGPDWDARGSRRYIQRAVEASLRRLDTEWIDLYQLHEPDLLTPIEETLAALTDLVTAGKVRYIGCSNFAGWRLTDASWTSSAGELARFISVQNEYSLLNREIEAEVVPACERFGVGILPYFPLAHGLLTGKYRRDERPAAGTRLANRLDVYDHARLGRDRGAHGIRGRARSLLARRGYRRAGRATVRVVGDRRRDHAGPGAGKRGGRIMGTVADGSGRA